MKCHECLDGAATRVLVDLTGHRREHEWQGDTSRLHICVTPCGSQWLQLLLHWQSSEGCSIACPSCCFVDQHLVPLLGIPVVVTINMMPRDCSSHVR